MKRGKIILMVVVILRLVSRKGYGQESPEEILLTAPLFFENRIPEELTEITELADEIVYGKIGVHVRFVPVLRLTGRDTRRNKEMLLLEREGAVFDLLHASMNGYEFAEITELVAEYGTDILELFKKNGQDLLEGNELRSIPSLGDYVSGQGIAMRKDILEKYKISLDSLQTYADFDQLFAWLAPLEERMKMICSYSTKRGLLYRYTWNGFENTVFCVSEDDGEVANWYGTQDYRELVQLFRKWYEQGYLYEYSALQEIQAADLVRSGILFSYVCAYKPGIETEVSNHCGRSMVVKELTKPMITNASLERGCWGISKECAYPEKAMQLLNLLYTDRDLINLLANGIEGVHYKKCEDDTIVPAGREGFFNDASWILPNQYMTDVRYGDDARLWDMLDCYNRSAVEAPNLFFAFDDTAVKAENAAINKIASEYTYGLESGQLDPDIYLPEMLGKMQEAGETQVCLELSGQYQAWRTEQKERNGGKK